jgi:5-methylcytosine-specific restriction endonuclease McrA
MGQYGTLVCELIPDHPPTGCAGCGKPLPPRRTRWCSDKCSSTWWRGFAEQHDWADARAAALKRDGHRCTRCGADDFNDSKPHMRDYKTMDFDRFRIDRFRIDAKAWRRAKATRQLEVNHIVPRVGAGYGRGCWNHLSNLETVCHRCHVEVTKKQRVGRARQTLAS